MCGIYSLFNRTAEVNQKHECIKKRGPDETIILDEKEFYYAFYRLSIVDVNEGHQPFKMDDIYLMCNGEIYNHTELESKYNVKCKTNSDCEIILHLYQKIGIERTIHELRGEFAFVLYDRNKQLVFFARDVVGVKPLYMSKLIQDKKIISLEIASLVQSLSYKTEHVLPNQLYTYDMKHKTISHQPVYLLKYMENPDTTNQLIYDKLLEALKKRIKQTERPLGFLLSGGLDSSTLLCLALKHKLITKPKVFTFGFDEKAPDVLSAKCVVKYLHEKYGPDCIDWHLVIEPISKGLESIPEVISILETYDTTTIRASVPMYLISKYIETKTNVKVLISGEGADELFGGYLYFKYAPNDHAFRSEILRLLNELYMYDCLRADRSTAACGLEVRPPFLDLDLIQTVLTSDQLSNKTMTKQLLRDVVSDDVLPVEILYGKKEAFSDAVSLSWQTYVEEQAIYEINKKKSFIFEYSKYIKPASITAQYFQKTFYQIFGNKYHLLKKLWLPNQEWIDTNGEPSARVLSVYTE